MVWVIDLMLMTWSFTVCYFLVKQFAFSEIMRGHFFVSVGVYGLITAGVFFVMRIHTGIIRYSNTQDIVRIFSAVFVTSLFYCLAIKFLIGPISNISSRHLYTVVFLNFFISSSTLILLRIWVKNFFFYIRKSASADKNVVLIYGAGTNAVLVKQALEANNVGNFSVSGFVDDNPSRVSKYIEQKRVYHVEDIEHLKKKLKVDKLVVVSDDLKTQNRKKTIEKCVELGMEVITVPPTDQWLYGKLRKNQIQDLKIEDLLQREPIVLVNDRVGHDLTGKRVLVTGGAGSIGSEIVRQVLHHQPEMLIVCDQAESPLHEVQLEVQEMFPEANIRIYLANIQNSNRMQALFKECKPQVVFHAAAYKHVPMMEHNVAEAILTNVLGTKTLADLSLEHGVEKFVMVSTDKAVNPTNIMGASKRIAEMYIQSLNNSTQEEEAQALGSIPEIIGEIEVPQTKFITTRFGNVLGSNGSVIPRFRSQIQKGGPITVTHPDITRYFMTIPEAVQLVLEAGVMGKGGEIFLFDMGEPVKIVDLARKMILLSGLQPEVDIKIEFTGLRPGEKLYEELLNKEELAIPTHHEKIKISQVIVYPYNLVESKVNELISFLHVKKNDELGIVRKMKQLVPEFKSKNSKYEQLDLELEHTRLPRQKAVGRSN
jgi:FlaA1/EpsC-like NDP-sugar epimerase